MSQQRAWSLVICVCAFVACHRSVETPGHDAADDSRARQEFAGRVKAELSSQGVVTRYDRDRFALIVDSDAGTAGNQMFLENAYRESIAAPPGEREALLARYIRVWKSTSEDSDAPTSLSEVERSLIPVVREGLFFERTLLETHFEMAHQPLAGPFHIGLVIDSEESMKYVTKEQLQRWRVDFEKLLAVARRNLEARSRKPFLPLAPGAFISSWHDSYDGSRILLTDRIRQLGVHGAPVIVMPNRDTLLVTGDADANGLLAVANAAELALKVPRAMNGLALRLQAGHWVAFAPAASSEVRLRFKRLEIAGLQSLYNEQGEALERSLKDRGEDVFVAHYNAVEHKDNGELSSYSVWTHGVPTLLPRTDKICFMDPDLPKPRQVRGCADWAAVAAIVGSHLTALGMSPERYRVGAFPSNLQLANMHLTTERL